MATSSIKRLHRKPAIAIIVACLAMPVAPSLAGGLGTAPGQKLPQDVPVEKLPQPVVTALKQQFPNAKIVTAALVGTGLDVSSWNLSVTVDKQPLDVEVDSISGDYRVNSIRKPLAIADIPKPVREAVEAKYPQTTIQSAWEEQNGLRALPPGKTKQSFDYHVTIATAKKETLYIFLKPELKRSANGETAPDPEKMQIYSESPVLDLSKVGNQ